MNPKVTAIGAILVGAAAGIYFKENNAKPTVPTIPTTHASCIIGPNGKPCNGKAEAGTVTGTVSFIEEAEDCKIKYSVSGLTPGEPSFYMQSFASTTY